MLKEYKKVILTRPKLVSDVKCPKCRHMDIVAIPIIETKCRNCKTVHTTEVKINIYFTVSKKIEQILKYNNGVYIIGERDDSKVFHTDDMLKPRSRHEDDIWHTLVAIQQTKIGQKCWEVEEITHEYDFDYRISCNDCGYCLVCVTCTKCNRKYQPKEIETGRGKEKRYTCPECNSKSYKQTVIEKFKTKGTRPICPYCNSNNIAKAKFSSDKKQCPKCLSVNITKPRKIPVYCLLIERQKRNWI